MQLGSAERFMQQSEFLIYGNGKDNPPTGFMFEKQQLKGLYFNQSPTKVYYAQADDSIQTIGFFNSFPFKTYAGPPLSINALS